MSCPDWTSQKDLAKLRRAISSAQFSFIFLPPDLLPPLSSYTLLGGLIFVEILGIYRGWGRFDHWAHLGGYLAGIAGAQRLLTERRRKEAERRRQRGWLDQVWRGER